MSLKDVLYAQKSGELDLIPGSPFNEPSPLVVEVVDDGRENGVFAYVMIDGDDWYNEEVTIELVKEALELLDIDCKKVEVTETKVISNVKDEILFCGEDIADLFGTVAAAAGIYINMM